MRNVKFKKWVPKEYDLGNNKIKEGTNTWEPDYINDGLFHQWASSMEEGAENFGNYTIGIIELSDGTITEVLPQNIKFIN